MSKGESLESLLKRAESREKKYYWLEAAELYEQGLGMAGKDDFSKKGEIQEKIGYSFYRAARQAEAANQFGDRMNHAVASYEKAAKLYGKSNDLGKTHRMIRCNAMVAYLSSWLASEVSEKKRLLSECWKLTKEALKALQRPRDALEYSKTYDQLSSAASRRIWLEWDFQTREKIVREMEAWGEKAIALLSSVEATYELAGAYMKTALCLVISADFLPEIDEKVEYSQKSLDYWEKARNLSEEAALLELLNSFLESLGWGADEGIPIYEKALAYAEKTKDNYMIGTALDMLAYFNHWKAKTFEDPDKCFKMYQKALKYAEDAKRQYSLISYTSHRAGVLWSGSPYVEHYWACAWLETDLTRRHELLEKAVANGIHAVELAESLGYPDDIGYAHHAFSKALGSLEQMETNAKQKKKFLENALEHRKESIKIYGKIDQFHYWNLGVMWNYSADLKAELSDYEKDPAKKKTILEEAVSDKEQCLQLCKKGHLYWTKIGEFTESWGPLGRYQYSHGELLSRLYRLTNNDECQKEAIKAFEEAAESLKNLDMTSRLAECYWKAARGWDTLGEYQKASENFKLASGNYASAADKIPQLKTFYSDYATYMQAWSEIEKAKQHHAEKHYGLAKEHYKKAANLHQKTQKWNYLSPNYLALTLMEEAEDISRREQAEEAKNIFQHASKLFLEARKSIKDRLGKIETTDEREMAAELGKALAIRSEYCLARTTLEEAKILDRQGDHASSSNKYASAAEKFQTAIDMMESEPEREELKPIVDLCHAWQMMTRAEVEAQPDLYQEASRLFDEAKNHSSDEKAKMLALGHSSFCKALEAGTKFEAVRDIALHTMATQHLEGAASFYLKAGYGSASDYAEATQKLLDGYLYMHNAKTETDPTKKARFYMMTEKVLQASAGSYLKAKHPEKHEQVSRLLEKVRKERELALSLTEVLHAPLATSTTATFASPTPTKEMPIGLEQFEHADIQANLVIKVKEVKVDENLDLRVELVNAGKAPALLIKIDELIPEGFEVRQIPDIYNIEDSHIDLKGKRLNPLRTENVKMTIKTGSKGTFTLKPRILYLDETGKYKSHEPEPVTITVKELGISGWIKGRR